MQGFPSSVLADVGNLESIVYTVPREDHFSGQPAGEVVAAFFFEIQLDSMGFPVEARSIGERGQ